MQYTKPMIELVMQIRKWMPSELKPDVKLANPNLFNILALHYHDNCEIVAQALIKELFTLAGENWMDLLISKQTPQPKAAVKVYRGQTRLEEKPVQPNKADQQSETPVKKKARFYRGVEIID
jgi:hypothetical protein